MLEYHYMQMKCAQCPKKFTPATKWQRFCSPKCRDRAAGASRDYVRTEVRFDDEIALDLVRRAAKAAKAKSMNAWIVGVLLVAATNELHPPIKADRQPHRG